jgi:hypothetical protein
MTDFHRGPATAAQAGPAFFELLGAVETRKLYTWAQTDPAVQVEALTRLREWHRTEAPSGQPAARTRHHEPPVGVSTRRAGRGLFEGAARPHRGSEAAGDPRCRDQIMADTLVERLTGQATAADVNTELQIVMPIEALLEAGCTTAAELEGYGPLPADLARDILATSKGRLWWRRLYAAPLGGPIVGGDPLRRHFDGFLKKLIKLRDRRCRDPYCDAPIRHIDHIQRFSDGGLTIYPNGRGTCERGNYAREMPGWNIDAASSGLDGQHHTIKITTPTGHTYLSRAP